MADLLGKETRNSLKLTSCVWLNKNMEPSNNKNYLTFLLHGSCLSGLAIPVLVGVSLNSHVKILIDLPYVSIKSIN
jgi:hypothetical protein